MVHQESWLVNHVFIRCAFLRRINNLEREQDSVNNEKKTQEQRGKYMFLSLSSCLSLAHVLLKILLPVWSLVISVNIIFAFCSPFSTSSCCCCLLKLHVCLPLILLHCFLLPPCISFPFFLSQLWHCLFLSFSTSVTLWLPALPLTCTSFSLCYSCYFRCVSAVVLTPIDFRLICDISFLNCLGLLSC